MEYYSGQEFYDEFGILRVYFTSDIEKNRDKVYEASLVFEAMEESDLWRLKKNRVNGLGLDCVFHQDEIERHVMGLNWNEVE